MSTKLNGTDPAGLEAGFNAPTGDSTAMGEFRAHLARSWHAPEARKPGLVRNYQRRLFEEVDQQK